ncbi:DUF2029 domain-containing protein [Candidatus Sumerlaeota bacterium]|nr:DUF2029 domain-containing protein [Candidatus Sumerlaeota bacterium]
MRKFLLWLVIAVAMYFYVKDNCINAYHRMHINDFKHIYLGAEVLLKGGNPYDARQLFTAAHLHNVRRLNPYVYPPFTGLVLGFLTFFDLFTAARIWFLLNHFFLWLSIVLLFISLRLPLRVSYFALGVFLGGVMFPFYRTLTAGQLNCALLLLIVLIWWAYSRKKYVWAGFLVAFATLFKLAPAIFFLLFLWRRDWRTLRYAILSLIVLVVLSIGLVGLRVHLDFIPVLKAMSYGHSTWAAFGMDFYRDPFNQSFNSLFHHLFTENPYTTPWIKLSPYIANIFTYIVAISLVVIVLARTLPARRISATGREDLEFSLFVFLMLLIPSLFWDHYLTILIFPIFVLSRYVNPGHYPGLFLFVCSVAIVCIPINFGAPAFRRGLGILLMSAKLWATLILMGLTFFYLTKTHYPAKPTSFIDESPAETTIT